MAERPEVRWYVRMAERPDIRWVYEDERTPPPGESAGEFYVRMVAKPEDKDTPPPGEFDVRMVALPPRYAWQDGTHTFPGGGPGGTDLIAAYVEVALVVTAADGRRCLAIHDPRAGDGPLLPADTRADLRDVVHFAWKHRNRPGPPPAIGRDWHGDAIAMIRELRAADAPQLTQETVAEKMRTDPRNLRSDRTGASWADLLKEAAEG